MKHLLDMRIVTTHGHVKGRGLARKVSTHCVVFLERERAPDEHTEGLYVTATEH